MTLYDSSVDAWWSISDIGRQPVPVSRACAVFSLVQALSDSFIRPLHSRDESQYLKRRLDYEELLSNAKSKN